jgi:hypothetical protein
MAEIRVEDAIKGLIAGDFSRLEPIFVSESSDEPLRCQFIEWYQNGVFADHPRAVAEALTCACFLGYRDVARHLLDAGVDPSAGAGTGLNAFHWAANRGQLQVVKLLIERKAPLEERSMYDGTVLGTAVWAAVHEAKPNHQEIIETLINAGARIEEAEYPSGDDRIDELLRPSLDTAGS